MYLDQVKKEEEGTKKSTRKESYFEKSYFESLTNHVFTIFSSWV